MVRSNLMLESHPPCHSAFPIWLDVGMTGRDV